MLLALIALALLGRPADAQFLGGGTTATYVGPGDIVSGATAWYGLRAYKAAYASPGTNKSVNLRRASDNATCDFVIATSGDLGGTASTCAQGSGLSLAAFATQDATCTGTISSTTLTCASASSTPHAGSTLAGIGITQPSFIGSCGTFTGGAGTCTLNASQTVGVGETITMTYGLFGTKLYDQSGSNACSSAPCDVTQAAGASQPQVIINCNGVLPCLSGAGAQWFGGTMATGCCASPGSAIFAGLGSSGYFLGLGNNYIALSAGTNTIIAGASSDITVTASSSTWHSVSLAGSTTASQEILNVDGVGTSGTGIGTASNNIGIMNRTASTFIALSGVEAEAGIYLGILLTPTQQTNLCHNQRLYFNTGGSC